MGAGIAKVLRGGNLGTLRVGIEMPTKTLAKDVDKAGKELTGLEKDTKASMTRIGASLLGIGVAVTAGVGIAISQFATFEKSMKNVQAVSNATQEEYKQLSIFAQKMGRDTAFSAREAADGLYFLASAGFDVQEQMAATEGILALAAATQSDLAAASKVTVTTLSAFNLKAGEAGRVGDIFAKAISASQATLEKLTDGLPYTATLFNDLGWSIEQNVAALSLLADKGLPASIAATQLRTAIKGLLDPTDKIIEGLEGLSLTIEDVSPKTNTLVEIVTAFEKAGLDAASAAQIFGKRGDAMSILAQTGAGRLREFTKALEDAGGAAQKMADIQLEGLSGSLTILKSSLEGLGIAFGQQLAPEATKVAKGLIAVTNAFSALPLPIQKFIAVGTLATGVLAGIAGASLLLLPRIPAMIEGFALLVPKALALGTALAPIGVALGIVAVGALAVVAGYKLLDKALVDGRKELVSYDAVTRARRGNMEKIQGALDGWRGQLEKLTEAQKNGLTHIQQLDQATGQWIAIPVDDRLEAITQKIEYFDTELRKAGGDIWLVSKRTKELAETTKDGTTEIVQSWEDLLAATNAGTTEYDSYYDLLTASFNDWVSITGEGYRASITERIAFLDELLVTVDQESTAWIGLSNLKADLRDKDILDLVAKASTARKIQNSMLDEQYRLSTAALEAEMAALLIIEDDGYEKIRKANDRAMLDELNSVQDTEGKKLIFVAEGEEKKIHIITAGNEVVKKIRDDGIAHLEEITNQQIHAGNRVGEAMVANRKQEKALLEASKVSWGEFGTSVGDTLLGVNRAYYGVVDVWRTLTGDQRAFHDTWISDMADWVTRIAKLLDAVITIWTNASTIIAKIAQWIGGDGGGGAGALAALAQAGGGGGVGAGTIASGVGAGAGILGKIGGGAKVVGAGIAKGAGAVAGLPFGQIAGVAGPLIASALILGLAGNTILSSFRGEQYSSANYPKGLGTTPEAARREYEQRQLLWANYTDPGLPERTAPEYRNLSGRFLSSEGGGSFREVGAEIRQSNALLSEIANNTRSMAQSNTSRRQISRDELADAIAELILPQLRSGGYI